MEPGTWHYGLGIVVGGAHRRLPGVRRAQVRYRDELPGDAASLLPERVVGARIHQRMQNFVTPIAAVRRRSPSLERRLLVDVA